MSLLVLLGIPTQPKKCHPPAQLQKILGFMHNTVSGRMKVPLVKATQISDDAIKLAKQAKVTRRELSRINGKFSWIVPVIFGSKAFVRNIQSYIDRNHMIPWDRRSIRMTQDLRRDLHWWSKTVLSSTSGISFELLLKHPQDAKFTVFSDASGNYDLGVGGYSPDFCSFYQISWKFATRLYGKFRFQDIFYLEMIGVVLNFMLFAQKWKNSTVRIYCDNLDVVHAISKKKASHDRQDLNDLIRLLCEIAMNYRFYFWIEHIPGKQNVEADKLSRFAINPFARDPVKFSNMNKLDVENELAFLVSMLYNSFYD